MARLSHVVLRPVFFMENLLAPGTLNGEFGFMPTTLPEWASTNAR